MCEGMFCGVSQDRGGGRTAGQGAGGASQSRAEPSCIAAASEAPSDENTGMTMLGVLLAVKPWARMGVLYDVDGSGTISSAERALRVMANDAFKNFNERGGL